MKLLTHNMLTSKCMKGVTVGYPLKIQVCIPIFNKVMFQINAEYF